MSERVTLNIHVKTQTTPRGRGYFSVQDTARLRELEGVPLVGFGQRLLRFAIDVLIAVLLWAPAEGLWRCAHRIVWQRQSWSI